MPDATNVLLFTGAPGAGKSTVLMEASDLLAQAGIQHAAIDSDELDRLWPAAGTDELVVTNLAHVWATYSAHGARRLLLAFTVTSAEDVAACKRAVACADFFICRLRADEHVLHRRLEGRETAWMLDRIKALASTLQPRQDALGLDDHVIATDDLTPNEVARQALIAADWLSTG